MMFLLTFAISREPRNHAVFHRGFNVRLHGQHLCGEVEKGHAHGNAPSMPAPEIMTKA